jgi:hypothetical protein
MIVVEKNPRRSRDTWRRVAWRILMLMTSSFFRDFTSEENEQQSLPDPE